MCANPTIYQRFRNGTTSINIVDVLCILLVYISIYIKRASCSVTEWVVQATEFTQSGNCHFLAYIPSVMEKSAQPGEGGGCTPTHFHYVYHHEQSCGVHSSFSLDTLPLFLLYPYMYSVVQAVSPSVCICFSATAVCYFENLNASMIFINFATLNSHCIFVT